MTLENKLKKRNNVSVGVIGSGLMGHGIAYAAALSGFKVLMLDITEKKAKEGLEKIYQILDRSLEKGFITKAEMDNTKSQIKISTDYEALTSKNIIIEAIYEDLKIKTKVLKIAERFLKPNGFIASNTSTQFLTFLLLKGVYGNA